MQCRGSRRKPAASGTEGFTHEYQRQRQQFEAIVERVYGQYLNDILPMQPSLEVLALWLLAQTEPACCDHVILSAYGGFEVRVDRSLQRSEWLNFLAGRGADPFEVRA
jgi:hypothetical protein